MCVNLDIWLVGCEKGKYHKRHGDKESKGAVKNRSGTGWEGKAGIERMSV
jgi:hypothetical protein